MKKKRFILSFLALSALILAACKDKGGGGDDTGGSADEITLAKKELRAAWMVVAWGLDWPQGEYDVAKQKSLYVRYMDKLVECNMNAVFVQVRGMADALYASPYEPWSGYITGIRGKDPGYDVLKFMIDEAHARGIEFHAWMNPYRIASRASSASAFPALDTQIDAAWVKDYQTLRYYNPALPEVHQRIVDIVKDLIVKYDVDGIHFDDYFYPESPGSLDDADEYTTYGSGYAKIEDWRRGNVDKVVKGVYDMIVATKPGVLFSISPAPDNTNNVNTLYADVTKWCEQAWLDMVIPQLYPSTKYTTASGFSPALDFWSQYNGKATLVIGYGLYRYGNAANYGSDTNYASTNEMDVQFLLVSKKAKVMGGVHYSAKYLLSNAIGVVDKLKTYYRTPMVMPFMGRTTVADPVQPTNVGFAGNKLTWNGGTGLRSVVYKRNSSNEGVVVAIVNGTEYTVSARGDYFVTTINGDNKESVISKVVTY